MWHSSDISMESLLDTCEFPAVCPVCGHRGGHIYLRADRPRRGGLWIWCSACRSFEHASIIPPSYWANDALIESFQLHAIPDLLEEQKDAIDAYMTQNYRGLDSDLCACCIRNADLSSLVCTQCHGKDTKAFLEGHSLVLECQSCGYRVVGASFYSPCEQDRKPYYLWIREDRIPAAVLVKLGSMLHIRILEMKRQIENREKLNRSLSLKEIMEASRFLKEEGISHDILPAIRYSRYYECGKKLKSLT